jgi:peptidoglycan/LPS O-acetylase OafA/YrhL
MVVLSKPVQKQATGLPSRLPTLTGMRFIAAAMVFFFHVDPEHLFSDPGVQSTYSSIVYHGGWAGVGFFFVLSGFVLTWVARPTDRTGSFYRRRLLKIFPNHIVTYVAAVILIVFVSGLSINGGTALANFFLIHAWFPDLAVRISVNDVTWSLSCELLYYLAFPLLYLLVKRIRPERLWMWATGVAAVAVVGVPLIATLLPKTPFIPPLGLSYSQFWFILQFPPVRALEFLFGMILARYVMSGRRLPLGFGGSVALAVAAYALAPLFPPVFNVVAVLFIPMGLVVAAGAVADVEGKRTFLSSRTMVWLGEISFAFYLWHRLVLMYGHKAFGGGTWSLPVVIALMALFFGVAVLLAALTFTFVERPIMQHFGRRRVPRGPTPAPEFTR